MNRALQGCVSDTERDIVRGAIRQMAKEAAERGDFDKRDWTHEPLPLYGPNLIYSPTNAGQAPTLTMDFS